MKTKIFALASVLVVFTVLSTSAQNKENGVFIELNLGRCETETTRFYDGCAPGERHFERYMIYTPTVGYQINNRWAVGLRAQFETKEDRDTASRYNTFGVYGQYRFFNRKWLKLFVEGSIAHGFIDDNNSWCRNDFTEAGFNLGVAVPIYRGLSFMARYLHVGYSDAHPLYRRDLEGSAYWGDGNWVVDGNLRRLSIGLQYRF